MKQILIFILVSSTIFVYAQTAAYSSPFPQFTPYQTGTVSESDSSVITDYKELGLEQPARWLSVDPMADKYPGWSPYNYCMNNPMRLVDPNGMWSVSTDSTGKVTATYEEGDTYENLYSQLGMSMEQFAEWTASNGIILSLSGQGMSFNITQFTVSNNNYDPNFTGSNCHGFVAFATGATKIENAIGGRDILSTLGTPLQTNTPKIGDIAVFPLNGDLVQTDGSVTLSKGDPAHSAIFVLNNHAGEAQFLNRINTGQPVTINNANQIGVFFNGLSREYASLVQSMPSVAANPIFFRKK